MSDINFNKKDRIILELDVGEKNVFSASIKEALEKSEIELTEINETIDSLNKVKTECDKLDYILAASSGALCGIIDIFLVGKPNESKLNDLTDKWFEDRVKDFAKWNHPEHKKFVNLSSAIRWLEERYKIPYDQSVGGSIFKDYINLTPSNHHFKSLGHNPSLLGLFFSILSQFENTSNFVSNGEFITLSNNDNKFELIGNDFISKVYCGLVNWLGHLFSDVSGSSGSALKGNRGMGIPSPFWTWTNDIIVIKKELNISPTEFDKTINDLAIKIFEEGYDIRFQTTQVIPVFINELLVRLIYSIRRLLLYFKKVNKEERNFKRMWISCEPFSNNTIKRMLTVAHGTFCLIDLGDSVVMGFTKGGGSFNAVEFVMRLNIAGLGRFAISLYGEGYRSISYYNKTKEEEFSKKEITIINNYIDGLNILSEIYDDEGLLDFIEDLKNSELYICAFKKTVELAIKRGVPENKILFSKDDIDKRFGGN